MRVAALAEAVILAWGWRKRLIALFAGAIGALALPPLDPATDSASCGRGGSAGGW